MMQQTTKTTCFTALVTFVFLLMASTSGVGAWSWTTKPSNVTMDVNADTREFITGFRKHLKQLGKIWKGSDVCMWDGVVCDTAKNEVHLVLADNRLSGIIPPLDRSYNPDLVRVASINMMGVSKLTGPFPEHWGSISPLRSIILNGTRLSGTIPNNWGRLKNLAVVDVSNTKACGSFPEWNMSMMPSLQLFALSGNRGMQGTLSRSFGSFSSKMIQLDLAGTNFCGCMPNTWVGDSLRRALQVIPSVTDANCNSMNKCTANRMLCVDAAFTTNAYSKWVISMALAVLWFAL